jgi:hypothetical protein
VGAAEVLGAGKIGEFVPGPVCIGYRDPERGRQKRRVVVAPVPHQHLRLPLRLGQNRRVVGAGEDHGTARDVRLVFLALLDRAVVAV